MFDRNEEAKHFLSSLFVHSSTVKEISDSSDDDVKEPSPRVVYAMRNGMVAISTVYSFMKKTKPQFECSNLSYGSIIDQQQSYEPLFEMSPQTNLKKTVVSLPGMLGTIIQYMRPEKAKIELNVRFRKLYPNIDPTLKFSQISKLKRLICSVCEQRDLEQSTRALSMVYLEKLVLNRTIRKETRKLIASACLVLACKANEPKGTKFDALVDHISRDFQVTQREIYNIEFFVFQSLLFNLYVSEMEYKEHLQQPEL